MSEFRIASHGELKRERKARLFLWSSVVALSGIAMFSVYWAHVASPVLNSLFTVIAILILAAAVGGAYLIARHFGRLRFDRDTVYVLTDRELVRKRAGWPDARIDISEITGLEEHGYWLVIQSRGPERKIAIPTEVENFSELRGELAKHCPVITKSPHASWLRFMPLVAALFCWIVLFLSRESRILQASAAVCLVLLGLGTLLCYKKLRLSPRRLILSIILALAWLATFLAIYFRVVRTP